MQTEKFEREDDGENESGDEEKEIWMKKGGRNYK